MSDFNSNGHSAIKKSISVFGGGLVGSLLSILLAQKGHNVKLFEKREDLRKVKNWDEGRSINLALSNRGWKALQMIGIEEEVKKISMPMYGRIIHHENGNILNQPYGKEGESIFSVSRGKLNEILLDYSAHYPNMITYFKHRCLNVDLETATADLKDLKNNQKFQIKNDLVFGADGAFSTVRMNLQKTNRFNYSQHYIDYGYKELTIPGKDSQWQADPTGLHIWPRKNFMLIALPNSDGSFTCTLFLAFEGEYSFASIITPEDATDFFEKHFKDALELMPNLAQEFTHNPTSSLVTIKCYPWTYSDKVALVGDASHAIVPFYGQGMNSGFEDCTILNELITKDPDNWHVILDNYQKSRKPDTDAMSDLAMQNFIEMRDLVADPVFLLRKKIEAFIYKNFPNEWIPLYSMVTFSHIPYSEALRIGKKQDEIMAKIMEIENIDQIWETLDYGSILKFNKALSIEKV